MITKVMKVMRERSTSVEETRAIGARLAAAVSVGDVISIDGDLGSGKTELVRGFVSALAADAEVRSPTFSIVNAYKTSKFTVYHFDFYRMESPKELDTIGFDEYISGDGVCLIEWGGMFPDRLPSDTKFVRVTDVGENARIVEAGFMF